MIEEIEISDLDKMSSFVSRYRCKSSGVADFIELIQLAKERSESIKLLSLKDQGKIVAISLFQFSERRVSLLSYRSMHLYGFDFYDYNSLNIQEKYELQFLNFIKRYAKRNHAQLIILENVIKKLRYNYNSERIRLFDSLKSENGFDYIINKKRLKRYKKKLEESFEYTVSHYSGIEITEVLIDELADLHKERWGFDSIQSAFCDEKRKQDYLTHRENKVLTIIRGNDSVLAVHYGMIFNNCVLFHTPVINIEYYKYSPYINFIEVLILETALYCKENQIEVLDFGLGDEIYKNKYTNSYKEVFTYYLTIGVISTIRFKITTCIKKSGAKNLTIFIREMHHKIQVINNKINVYKYLKSSNNKKQSKDFHYIENYPDFVSLYRKLKYPVKRYHYNRFSNGDSFYFLLENNNLYCSGWSTSKDMYVSEVDKILKVSGRVILYDYHTPERFRRQGKYQELLESIINYLNSDLFIYALTKNIGSNRAIQNVGFKKSIENQLK
jgi:hypothetical protein